MNKATVPFMWVIVVVVIIVAAILILYAPAPVSSGSCIAQCSEHTVGVVDPYNANAENICGAGCLIKEIDDGVAVPFTVTCRCCDCVGSSQAGLGQCNYPIGIIFNPLGRMVGLCV